MKLISIIIATYNAEKTIEDTLQSIELLPEDVKNKIEVVVVDGASTDETLARVNCYKNIDIHISSEPDSGIYDAMNKGVQIASAEYLCFLGADDRILPEAFARAINVIIKVPEKIMLYYANVINDAGVTFYSAFSRKLFFRNTVHHQGAFYHQSVFHLNNYNKKLKYYADYDLNLKLYLDKVESQKLDLTIAATGIEGLTSRPVFKKYQEEIAIHFKLLPIYWAVMTLPVTFAKYLVRNLQALRESHA